MILERLKPTPTPREGRRPKLSTALLSAATALAAAALLLPLAPVQTAQAQSAPGFDWKQATGTKLSVSLNQHPYAEAIIQRLPVFKEMTGIEVQYELTPEENYFDKVTTALSSASGTPDVFMTGIYQMWDYASAKRMEPLDALLNDAKTTNPDYNVSDIFEGVFKGGKWDLKPGSPSGSGALYSVPLGFEMYSLGYNKKYFDSKGLKPPATFTELVAMAKQLKGWNGPGSYGVAVRGTRNWATIHPGYMSVFNNAGARDFEIKEGKLVSDLDQPVAIDITRQFADMVRAGGPPGWSNYTWYQCGADFGAGKAAMLLDADSLGYFTASAGSSKESGNLAFAPIPVTKEGSAPTPNEWVWQLGMNSTSKHKQAAWLFMQYFTGPEHVKWASMNAKLVDPARQSAWDNPEFKQKLSAIPGFYETFQAQIKDTSVKFTPQPYFIQSTTEWAATLQKIILSGEDPDKAMKELARRINKDTAKLKL